MEAQDGDISCLWMTSVTLKFFLKDQKFGHGPVENPQILPIHPKTQPPFRKDFKLF